VGIPSTAGDSKQSTPANDWPSLDPISFHQVIPGIRPDGALSMSWFSPRAVRRHRRPTRNARPGLIQLESRITPTNVLTYHNDVLSNGVNNAETTLTRANVNQSTFGRLWQTPTSTTDPAHVFGQIYAQPLVLQGVNITVGTNQGMHDVVFVATEGDQLYAFDANFDPTTQTTSHELLWHRSFLNDANNTNPGDLLAGATTVTTVPYQDLTPNPDITPEIGITGTPVIDPNTGTIYVVPKTKETVGGVAHYVQRLYAINIQTGADQTAPFLLGDTTNTGGTYQNYASQPHNSSTAASQIFTYGVGNGTNDHVTDPYNGTGLTVVQFNAEREAQRPALNLINGVVYIGWASHGDNGPYHGWMVGVSAYTAGTPTMTLKGVLDTTPNGGLGGIWQAGGALTFDGTYFYFETGNGTFDGNNGTGTGSNPPAPAPGPVTGLDNAGFPINGDFGDSFVKVALDPTTSATNQNRTTGSATQTVHSNGWGFKIVDYFTPFNQNYLNATDKDVGSSAVVVVPDYNTTIGGTNQFASAATPRLLVGSGKEGVIYILNRDNMGKYGVTNNIVQNTANELSGSLDSAALFNGRMYYVEGYGGVAKTFLFRNGQLNPSTIETQSTDPFSFAGSTPSISANNGTNGIVWDVDRGTNELRAYSSDSYATELYNSDQAPGGVDALGAAVKFQVVTVANGRVFVGAGTGEPNNFLDVYGLKAPPTQPPAAPSNLAAQPVSNSQINLTWTDNSVSPNQAYGFYVEQSPTGAAGSWTQIATATGTAYSVGGLSTATTYFFRIRATNSIGNSAYTGAVSATTTSQANVINYPTPNGFTGYPANGALTLNGGATIVSNTPPTNSYLSLTTGLGNQARSAFTSSKLVISAFTTTYTYLMTGTQGNTADGMTFTIQNSAATAVGGGGGSLGYVGITPSFALAINVYAGHPFGSEFLTNGTDDFNYSETNINTSLVNVPITVTMTYYGGNTLTATLAQGSNQETKIYTFASDLATLLGSTSAYVGFTAATGGVSSTQSITGWTFTQLTPPAVPTNLQAQVTGYTGGSLTPVPLGAHLTWTAAAGAASYKIERKLTIGGTYAQVGTSNTTSFDDTALTANSTYYYRVRATNQVGDGAYSAEVPVTTPALPPTATNSQLNSVTTTSVSFQWQDNANNEDGYLIERQTGTNGFVIIANLPPDTNPAPSTMTFTDTGLTPGTAYDYHIQSYNLAGYSDFAGVSTVTVTTAPTNLAATAANGGIGLTWTAPTGAATYNVYRGTSAGGEGASPIATGLTSPNFTDSPTTYNTTYYYQVTAVDAGGESVKSNESSAFFAAPPTVFSVQVNDGSAERSEVRSITVTFSGPVTFGVGGATAAFQMLHIQTGNQVLLNASVFPDALGRTVGVLTFSAGTETDAVSGENGFGANPSLNDGRYQLTILGAKVFGANGLALDGAGTSTPGSNYVTPTDTLGGGAGQLRLYRLFGDVNGDGVVDQLDLGQFRQTFNTDNTNPLYIAFLDADNSGSIDQQDLGQFRTRFNSNVF
jgi:hypothetical protein